MSIVILTILTITYRLNNKYITKILSDFTNDNTTIQSDTKPKRNKRRYNLPKIAQIAKMTLKHSSMSLSEKDNKHKHLLSKEDQFDYYFGSEGLMKGTKSVSSLHNINKIIYCEGNISMKNRDILLRNNNISINCINSSIDCDIHKDQLIGRSNMHKVMNIGNDVSFLRIKNMENKLKKLINSK